MLYFSSLSVEALISILKQVVHIHVLKQYVVAAQEMCLPKTSYPVFVYERSAKDGYSHQVTVTISNKLHLTATVIQSHS